MGRRASGEGSIFRTGNRWAGEITLGYDEDGKRIYKRVYGHTKKEVIEKLNEIKNEAKSTPAKHIVITEELKQEFLNYVESLPIKVSSKIRYKTGANSLFKVIQGASISDLKEKIKEYGEKRITDDKAVLHFFNFLVQKNIITEELSKNYKNEYLKIYRKKAKERGKQIKTLTQKQTQEFLAFLLNEYSVGNPNRTLSIILLFTGMRIGEALVLQKKDVDLGNKMIHVQRTYEFRSNVIGTPKSGKTRVVYIPEEKILIDELTEITKNKNDDDFLFEQNWKKVYESYRCFLRRYFNITPHVLRHTYATLSLQVGIPPKIVQEQLGHSDIKITLSVYSHALPSMAKEAVQKLKFFSQNL
ncbi:MAG: site-specific integrase [Brockia lithotrophica]|nr:site-specific integrase [Brockia lithotrophica]